MYKCRPNDEQICSSAYIVITDQDKGAFMKTILSYTQCHDQIWGLTNVWQCISLYKERLQNLMILPRRIRLNDCITGSLAILAFQVLHLINQIYFSISGTQLKCCYTYWSKEREQLASGHTSLNYLFFAPKKSL